MKKIKKISDFFSNSDQKPKMGFKKKITGDVLFRIFTALVMCNIFIIIGLMLYKITEGSRLSIETYGLGFLGGTKWQPFPPIPSMTPSFGALPAIWGTLVTSAIALLLGVPISLGIGLALSEFTPKRFNYIISFLVELLAAIPSVIYGLWGIFILIPYLQQNIYPPLQGVFGFLPIFQGHVFGPSVLTAGIVLAIMVIPTISAISRDVFSSYPQQSARSHHCLRRYKMGNSEDCYQLWAFRSDRSNNSWFRQSYRRNNGCNNGYWKLV